MDLKDNDWNFLARVVVTEYTIGNNKTEGTFVLVKDFSEDEKNVITKTFVSDQEVDNILKSID